MSDRLAARLRTLWPLWLGHLAALVVATIARWTGVHLDSAVVYEALGLLTSWAIWEAGSRLERSARSFASADRLRRAIAQGQQENLCGQWIKSGGRRSLVPSCHGQHVVPPRTRGLP